MLVGERVSGVDVDGELKVSSCLFPVTPAADIIEITDPCIDLPVGAVMGLDGPVGGVVYETGVGYAFRQEPLSAHVEGSSSVALPETTTSTAIHGLSMDGGRGAVLARTRQTESNDLSFMRLGCEP